MKTSMMCVAMPGIALLLATLAPSASAQATRDHDSRSAPATNIVAAETPAIDTASAPRLLRHVPYAFTERDMSGPRVGFMLSTSDGELTRNLRENNMGRLVSLFGWHFEHRITPISGGPQFLTEFVPLVGGVEYGKFLPSVTLAFGMRMRDGYEFGIGPSFAASGSGGGVSSGIVLSAGKSIEYSGVDLPMNLAVSLNQKGTVVSVTAGYAVNRDAR